MRPKPKEMLKREGCTAFMLLALLILVVVLDFGSASANAAKRIALVIGNSEYRTVPALPNAVNDADEMADKLRELGFTVQLLKDAGRNSLRDSLGEFSNAAMGSEIGLVFYAGHGIEVDRQNYLLPVDARLETDLRIRFEAVSLEDVLASLEGVTGIRIVMLDACRNNPFISSMKVKTANRSISRGLSRVEPSVGTLVSFSAKEGTTAADGTGSHSPYTAALLQNLDSPGLEVNKLFRLVRDDVLAATGGEQEPYTYGSTSGADVFLKEPLKEPPASAVPAQPAVPMANEVLTDFQLAKELNTVEGWTLFLEKHKDKKENFYVSVATQMLRKMVTADEPAAIPTDVPKSELPTAKNAKTSKEGPKQLPTLQKGTTQSNIEKRTKNVSKPSVPKKSATKPKKNNTQSTAKPKEATKKSANDRSYCMKGKQAGVGYANFCRQVPMAGN